MQGKELKNILFISYQFPPLTGAGVHRSLQFVKHLYKYGYNPIVIAKKQNGNDEIDYGLEKQLPNNITIYRLDGINSYKIVSTLMRLKVYRIFWYFLYAIFWESSVLWTYSISKKVEEIVKKEKPQIIYTTSGPFSSLLLGRHLQKKFKLKWIADLRDPFTDAYAWSFPSKLHWLIMRSWEKRIFSKPDKVIVTTNAVRELYINRKIINPEKIEVITNGY